MNMNEDMSTMEAQRRSDSTRQLSNIVIGASWAVGSLLAVIQGKQNTLGAKLLLLSLVLSIGFIVPLTSDNDPRSLRGVVLRSGQRGILHYCVGLFIFGIIISIS